eukprot:XP_011681093.1 PREDICTED: probable G-protein coupled receptor Mth-like 4 [Strongylocentrotus purpuratus]
MPFDDDDNDTDDKHRRWRHDDKTDDAPATNPSPSYAVRYPRLLYTSPDNTFRVTQTRSHRIQPSVQTLRIVTRLVGWGVPLLLVIVALGLHLTENDVLPLEYGSGRNCWVYPVLANIVFFIGPVVLSLVANVILFIITVVNICRTTKMTRGALQKNRSHKHVISELLIYFKISCLMGFSWLFGLVAALGTTSALWYLFITVNGLQGISVFLSFGVNARVRKLWSKKMTSAGSSASSGSSNTT